MPGACSRAYVSRSKAHEIDGLRFASLHIPTPMNAKPFPLNPAWKEHDADNGGAQVSSPENALNQFQVVDDVGYLMLRSIRICYLCSVRHNT